MKGFVVFVITAILVLGLGAISYADSMSTSKDILLTVSTTGAFGFEVWDTELDQNLGSIVGGSTVFADLHIYATSTHATQWALNASSDGLVGTLPSPDTIPIRMSTYDGAGVGLTGTIVDNLTLTGTPQPIYTAGAGEYPKLGLELSGLCIVETDPGIQADTYEGIVQLTMTE